MGYKVRGVDITNVPVMAFYKSKAGALKFLDTLQHGEVRTVKEELVKEKVKVGGKK